MNLLPFSKIEPLLICPTCREAVSRKAEGFTCPNGHVFGAAGSHPVLVDFESSILVEDELVSTKGASAIQRGNRSIKGAALGFFLAKNNIAATNAKRMVDAMPENGVLLIIGGADAGAGTSALYEQSNVIGFDIYGTDLTQFVADAHRIPLKSASVDGVWIQAVLEHVLDPWAVAEEIHRVLKPEGVVYAETPFLQPVHEGAYDFTRFTASGHRWLFRRFEEIESGVAMSSASQALGSVEHVVRGLFRSVKAGVVAKALLFWVLRLERFIPRSYSQDAASAVFFYGRRSERILSPKDMIAYYDGAHRR